MSGVAPLKLLECVKKGFVWPGGGGQSRLATGDVDPMVFNQQPGRYSLLGMEVETQGLHTHNYAWSRSTNKDMGAGACGGNVHTAANAEQCDIEGNPVYIL